MSFDKEYFEFVRQYATVDGVLMPPVISTLGLCGEAEELRASTSDLLRFLGNEDEVLKEAGDVLFYAVTLGLAYGIEPEVKDLTIVAGIKTTVGLLQSRVGAMADKMKKASWHFRPYEDLQGDLDAVVYLLAGVAADCGKTVDDVADINVEKLKARWPKGFGK